ncbi:MAG TPA: prefoldin subunit beta [Candidatus Norongarragalinales archaeon]|jgi:prefoldin beta subunit|nr:prefoldin subunit beta [Candidatus Norongarragalinales archaeon]
MPEISEDLRADITSFQAMQQQAQIIDYQKQQTQLQIADLDKALEEIEHAQGTVYRAAGPILVPKPKDVLKKELLEEKETLELRQGTLDKQEQKIRERLEQLKAKIENASQKMAR